jgi:branched-subunit amino acid aminotransferase/4-amino-4-deoxychorismate lyase
VKILKTTYKLSNTHPVTWENPEKVLNKGYNRLFLGEGLFETMCVKHGEVANAKKHWQRMNNSACQLSIPFPLSLSDWLSQLNQAIACSNCQNGIVKVILLPLSEKRGLNVTADGCEIFWQIYESESLAKAWSLVSLPWLRDSNNPVYRHKTLSYIENIQAKRYALAKGRDDVIIFDNNGYVLETSAANVFMILDGELYTPSLNLSILPGVMREVFLEKARSLGLSCHETVLSRYHLQKAEAIFITNSVLGFLPVHQIDDQVYPVEHEIYQLLKR